MTWWHPYIGLPYERAHCWELVRRVYADQLGLDLPAYGEIDAANLVAVARGMAEAEAADCWHPVDRPQAFDVALMRGRSRVWHVGVMVDDRRVLHTERATGAVLVGVQDTAMRGRVTGYRRHTEAPA